MKSQVSKIYDYTDETGKLIFQTVRFKPKNFRQRRPLEKNRFAWKLSPGWYNTTGGNYYLIKDASPNPDKPLSKNAIWLDKIDPVLYNLPLLKKAINKNETIFVVEGEKDADNICALGYAGTTCPMGAGKWQKSYTETLKVCRNVVIITDKDTKGRDHASLVAKELFNIGISVKVVEMPDINETKVKDFSDWHNAGGTKEEFDRLIADTPAWLPKESVDDSHIFSMLIREHGEPYYFNKSGNVCAVNESFFAELYFVENIILYEPVERVFYKYNNETGLYTEITEHIIKKEIAGRILEISRERNIPSLERLKKNSVLTNIIAHLKGIAERRNAFVKQSHFVHLGNGVLRFNNSGTVDFVKFSPTFFSRNQSPICYDPNAKCERFKNELLYPAVTPEDAILIQKYAGLSLLGNNLLQRLIIFDGETERGKTTLALVIQKFVGLNNVTELRTRHLAERFELFRYLKKTLLIGIDVPGNFLSQKGSYVIKGLLGGDYFDAEQKCGTGSFQLQGRYCIIITSNSRLQVKLDGDLGAWRRRLLIVRFKGSPPAKKIPNFADQLIKEEGAGILNWALQGLEMVLDDIRQYGDIQLTERQHAIVDALLAESDSLRHFLVDCVVTDEFSDLSIHEIVEQYAEYCPKKGWNPKPITVIQREIEGLMLELFHTAKVHSLTRDGKSARGFRRVGFKNEGIV